MSDKQKHAAFIHARNHPSSTPTPSTAEPSVEQRAIEALAKALEEDGAHLMAELIRFPIDGALLKNPPISSALRAITKALQSTAEAATLIEKLGEAARKALNYIENTESEWDITLDSGDALREALSLISGEGVRS